MAKKSKNKKKPSALENAIKNIKKLTEGKKCVFRGTDENYTAADKNNGIVISSLFKKHRTDNNTQELKELLEDIPLLLYTLEQTTIEKARKFFPLNTHHLEILSELRQYGAALNVIDFTYNLHIALFFACSSNFGKEDGEVIILPKENTQEFQSDTFNPKLDDIREIFLTDAKPTPNSQKRILAQSSVFVYAPKGYIDVDEHKFFKVVIEQQDKKEIFNELSRLYNISHNTIYNDVWGFIQQEANVPSTIQVPFFQGIVEALKENWEEALNKYNEAIKLHFIDESVYINRGVAKDILKQHQEAIEDYNQAIKLNSNNSSAYYNRGLAKIKLEQYIEAIADLNQAIKLNPKDAIAYYNRGFAQLTLKQYPEAIEDFNQVIKLNPKYENAYYSRGFAKFKFGKHEEAIADFNQVIKINPNDNRIYFPRGLAKGNLGKHEEAIADFNQVIKINPNADDAYFYRGLANFYLRQHEDAIADLNQAIKLNPNNSSAYFHRGLAKIKLDKPEEALADLNQAIDITNESKTLLMFLADIKDFIIKHPHCKEILQPVIEKIEAKIKKLPDED